MDWTAQRNSWWAAGFLRCLSRPLFFSDETGRNRGGYGRRGGLSCGTDGPIEERKSSLPLRGWTCQIHGTVTTGIGDGTTLLRGRSRCQVSGLDPAVSHQVEDSLTAGQKVVRDDASMAPPPYGFRAHHCQPPFSTQRNKPLQPVPELVGHCIVGIVVKALVGPSRSPR
jgi:hypothetical protein